MNMRGNSEGDDCPPLNVLLQQLCDRDAELEDLRKEEENLQQSIVKLKALVIAKQASPCGSPSRSGSSRSFAPASWQSTERVVHARDSSSPKATVVSNVRSVAARNRDTDAPTTPQGDGADS